MKTTFSFGRLGGLAVIGWLAVGLYGCGLLDGDEEVPYYTLTDQYRSAMAYDGTETLHFQLLDTTTGEVLDTLVYASPHGLEEKDTLIDGAESVDERFQYITVRFEEQSGKTPYLEIQIFPFSFDSYGNTFEINYGENIRFGDSPVLLDQGSDNNLRTGAVGASHTITYSTSIGITSYSINQKLNFKLIQP
jgi:hypothetical protein